MRREGIFSSLLSNWRKQRTGSNPLKRGGPANPEGAELARLRDEYKRLRQWLDKSERKIDALGKAHLAPALEQCRTANDSGRCAQRALRTRSTRATRT